MALSVVASLRPLLAGGGDHFRRGVNDAAQRRRRLARSGIALKTGMPR